MSEETRIDESVIFEILPQDIIVADDRPRQRKDLGEVIKLAESIGKFGQLLPIIIGRDGSLIAGGRRLAACMLLGIKARVCYKDTVDPLFMQEMELEENIQRKALTPAEESLAVAKLVGLKQKIYGKPTSGRKGGFTLENAAELLGKTKGSVIDDLYIADILGQFPNLSECGTKAEIKKTYKGLERIQQNITALASYEDIIKRTDEFVLVNKDARNYLHGVGDASVDLFFTDPPYGLDIHNIAMTTGGQTGGEHTTTGVKYEDSETFAKELIEVLAKESYRVTKDTGHAYIFCAPSHFSWISNCMAIAGWLVAPRPVVWIKRESGQNNQPDKWFSSAYEFVLFARKVNSQIILQGRPDWLQVDPVLVSEKVHQAEKPVDLCKELISRVCMPGEYMLDCCMGSGAIIEAGVRMKVLSLGCELDTEIYASAVARMKKLVEDKK
jgi:site-specific DNA-methyltransferase (adenine-specific)